MRVGGVPCSSKLRSKVVVVFKRDFRIGGSSYTYTDIFITLVDLQADQQINDILMVVIIKTFYSPLT